MDSKLDLTVEFINKNFNLHSELPDEINGGNPCYGQDVAAYIHDQLKSSNIQSEILDEDFGWAVFGRTTKNSRFEIHIYPWGFLNDAEGDGFHLWRLRLRSQEKSKFLGIFSVYKASECNHKLKDLIETILSSNGNLFLRMETCMERE